MPDVIWDKAVYDNAYQQFAGLGFQPPADVFVVGCGADISPYMKKREVG